MLRVVNLTRQQVVAKSVKAARSMLSRLRGLLFSVPLSEGEGLYLAPCQSIHMIGMSYAIDAIFVDKKGVVVGLVRNIQPLRISDFYWKAFGCLELPCGIIDATGTMIGDRLEFEEVV